MALRAVFREVRKAAKRLDSAQPAVSAIDGRALDSDVLRRTLNLRAWLLPEPFSEEAQAAAAPSQQPWQNLVHCGTRRALRAKLGDEELLDGGLTLLTELNALEHELVSSTSWAHQLGAVTASGLSVAGPGSHAALAGVLDGAAPDEVEQQIEDALDHLSSRALELADQPGSSLVAGVSAAMFDEMGLRALPPTMSPGGSNAEVDAYSRAALVHRALDTRRGTPLALGLILSEVLARCQPDGLPAPRLLALPRRAAPLATFGGAEEAGGGATAVEGAAPRLTNAQHATVRGALAAEQQQQVAGAVAAGGEALTAGGRGDASAWERRILVACADAARPGGVQLVDPTASGARTRLAPSAELLAGLRADDARWARMEVAARVLAARAAAEKVADAAAVRNRAATVRAAGARAAAAVPVRALARRHRGESEEEGPSPFEVPASALLPRRGVMELLLRQLAALYHADGSPQALKMHHRCAALLAELDQQ